jgi:hypothetical protein
VVAAAGAQQLQLFRQGIRLDEQGRIAVVQNLAQPAVCGHRPEHRLEERPDDRVRIGNEQQDRETLLLDQGERFVVPAAPKDALLGKLRFRHQRQSPSTV